MRRLLPIIPFLLLASLASAAELGVGAGQAHTSISDALNSAQPGDTITVHGGTYREGVLRIVKPVTLIGVGLPRIDGEGRAELVSITSNDVSISGFVLEHGGSSSLRDLAGIMIDGATRVTIAGNRIEDCAYGFHIEKSRDITIRDNQVTGNPERDEGNGIHLWNCERITIAGNHVRSHRDGIYLEFTTDTEVTGNTVEMCNRYGLHFMSAHRNTYRRNLFLRNGAGVAVMYSKQVRMEDNRFAESWGAASYGLLLKDIDDSVIVANTFDRNSTAVTMQNSNRTTFERNQFTGNGWALQVSSNCGENAFRENNFIGNSFDLATNGELELNRFEHNYWDKAEIYDLNRDGIGDVPYRPVSLFAMLVERMPSSLLLMRSPLVHFLDRAEKIIPSLTPAVLMDARPAMRPLAR